MAWSATNTIPAMQGKSIQLRELFAKVANAALDKGQTEAEAIFSGSSAVKIQEKKNQPVKPKIPAHLAAVRSMSGSPYEMTSKAASTMPVTEDINALVGAEFDNQGHLTLLFKDGRTIKTKEKAISNPVYQSVSVAQDNSAAFAMQEPTGFQTRTTSTISFNDSNRTFTIAATELQQGFNIWLHSRENTYYSESVQIPDTTGIHFIYFNHPSGILETTTTVSSDLFLNTALVALVYWRQDQQRHIYFADERHGIVMDGATHQHLHLSIGAQYRSGLDLTNITVDQDGSLPVHAQLGCTNGVIADEDLTISIVDNSPQDILTIAHLPVFYRIGSSSNWYRKTATEYALIRPTEVSHYTGITRPAYNYYNGTSWTLGEVPNNEFLLVHILATNDVETPLVAVLGNTYHTKTEVRTGAKNELKDMIGLPFLEFVKVGSVIFQTANSYTNPPKARIVSTDTGENYVDYRTSLAALVLF